MTVLFFQIGSEIQHNPSKFVDDLYGENRLEFSENMDENKIFVGLKRGHTRTQEAQKRGTQGVVLVQGPVSISKSER